MRTPDFAIRLGPDAGLGMDLYELDMPGRGSVGVSLTVGQSPPIVGFDTYIAASGLFWRVVYVEGAL